MEYNSFYGGRRGASFVIVERYASVFEMVQEFKKGGDYKTVNYDEYVIIDTENKNDIENGKIYRRGYDFNNELGGAEYVGQIVGPAGLGPHAEVIEKSEVNKKYQDAAATGDQLDYRYGTGTLDRETKDLVPGAKGDINNRVFDDSTDKIHWEYFSLRDDQQLESTCYIGFQVPYVVIDYTANSVDPYYHRSNNTDSFTNQNLIDRVDEMEHPFYEHWDVKIPKGIKGDAFKNFRVITADDSIEPYENQQDDITNNRQVFVYDYYHYDKEENGEPVTLYLGDYNMIKSVDLAEDGTFTVSYDHDNDTVFPNAIKWIDEVKLNDETGQFDVVFNYPCVGDENSGKSTTYTSMLDWVKDINFAEDGTITFDYTVSNANLGKGLYPNLIKWVEQVTLDENGHFTMTFNYDEKEGRPTIYETDLKWVNDISLAENGVVTLHFSYGQDQVLTNKVRWVTGTTFNPDGTLTFEYNYGEPDVYTKEIQWIDNIALSAAGEFRVQYNNGEPDYVTTLRWPINIQVNTGAAEGDGTQKLVITYNDGTTEEVGQPINYIMQTVIDSRYHLLALYSDPERRAQGPNVIWEGRDDWVDLGYVGNGTGVGAIVGETTNEGVLGVANTMPPYSGWFIVEE